MTTTDDRLRATGAPPHRPRATSRGPYARIVLASVLAGALSAAVLVLGALPGAPEHVTTGAALLGFAAGWEVLAVLTGRLTDSPQRWAHVLAAWSGAAGAALLALAPGDDGLTAAAWVWPPVVLVLVSWSVRQLRRSMPGRARWLLAPVLGALVVASLGALVQDVAVRRDASALTPPGRLVDVGDHRLHLDCAGTGSPTVVLESGLGGSSPLWSRISRATAATTRVCAYDRAGTGWSDDAAHPQDSSDVVTDLHRLLAAAGEPGPYVLAGHSTGGAYVLTYASRFPAQVAGVVLLDAASPWQFTVLPDYPSTYGMLTRLYGVLPTLVRLGAGRALPTLTSNDVPGRAGEQATALVNDPRGARTARDELSTYRRTFAQAQALTTLGSTPLVVLSAGDTMADTAGWPDAQQRLAELSSNADRRTVDSSHVGVLDGETGSTASVTAISDVVRAVRTRGHVAAR